MLRGRRRTPILLKSLLAPALALACACEGAATLPLVAPPPQSRCPDPNTTYVLVPRDVQTAAEVLVACSLDLNRVRAEHEGDFQNRTHEGLGRALRNTWLRERDTGVTKMLIDLGVRSPDDMSDLLLSAAWHEANGYPFDVKARWQCWQAALQKEIADRKAGIPEPIGPTPQGYALPPPIFIERCYRRLPAK